jgi:uroporphyrinogen-III synthase
MVTTRRSTDTKSGLEQNGKATAGTKRKEHATSPQSKHQPKAPKNQKTIEETIGGSGEQNGHSHEDTEMREAPGDQKVEDQPTEQHNEVKEDAEHATEGEKHESKSKQPKEEKRSDTNADAVEESSQRAKKLPSSILEKGIIYFFTRNRVGLEEAESVGDLQRTYFVLRPLPDAAKLTDGAIPDLKNNRLFALPKKTFPKSHSDRFMAFVEKAPTTIQDLKENFFKGAEYETQTSGTRQQQPIRTIGEGVYAITRTEDRTTHLAYALTIPAELGEVQNDLGLRSQGSFIMSVKNPERPGPASARLPEGPKFPKEYV